MRKTLASLLAALMVLTLGAGTATATGNPNTSLNVCLNEAEDYYVGIKVYARDKGRGPSRVMCPRALPDDSLTNDKGAWRFDERLNDRNRKRPPLEDIWNGFHRNIESFELLAGAGCWMGATLYKRWHRSRDRWGRLRDGPFVLFSRELHNREGTVPKTRLFEVPEWKDNRATKIHVQFACSQEQLPA
jgi:hypothetical protein